MFEVIGFIAVVVMLLWLTVCCFFATVPTLFPALFGGNKWKKLLGVVLWCILILLWYLLIQHTHFSLTLG